MAKTGKMKLAPRLLWFGFSALVLTVVLCSLPSTGHAQTNLNLSVSIDRDTISMDEQAVLLIEISGASQNLPSPQMPNLPAFEVYSQGRSSSLSITNGVMSSSVAYRYLLMPQKSGVYPIEGVTVVHENKSYTGNRVTLTVLDSKSPTTERLEDRALNREGDSKDYFLEGLVDKKKPFVNEQITLTLKFYTAIQFYGTPELTEPATTGFWTEILGNKAPYYQRLNNRQYKVIERKYALFPTQTGELTIGRAIITTTVAGGGGRGRDPFDVFGDFFGRGQEVTMRSTPITIDAQPLPDEGKPDNFTGSIGNYSITATSNKKTVEVNQPVSLTVKITGSGNIKSVAEPILHESNDFRIYKASSSESMSKLDDKLGGSKIFEEVFIPKRPGELEIPALEFNYFNPGQKKYVTLKTNPVKISVRKPEGYAASPELPYSPPGQTLGSQSGDIRYIKKDLGTVRPVGQILLLNPLYVVVNAIPVLVLAGMIVVRARRERQASNIGLTRSNSASRIARKRLSKAKSLARTNTAKEFYGEISLAVTAFIADKLNISPYGLTSDKIADLFGERSDDSQLSSDCIQLLRECDYSRFSSISPTIESIHQSLSQAEEVLTRLQGVRFG